MRFEVGKIYKGNGAIGSIAVYVVRRTPKTIWVCDSVNREIVNRCKVYTNINGDEIIKFDYFVVCAAHITEGY